MRTAGPPTHPAPAPDWWSESSWQRLPLAGKLVIIIGGPIVGLAILGSVLSPSHGTHTLEAEPADVVFHLSGTATEADITYTDSSGNIQQQTKVDVPLKRKSDGFEGIEIHPAHGAFVQFSAQNQGDSGNLDCSIESNGNVLNQGHASGGYAIVECSATVP